MQVVQFRSLAPVNEAHTELVRVKEVKREEQLRLMSKRAFQAQQASALDRRSMSEGLKRAGQQATEEKLRNPNTWRYGKPQRQLKHQVLQGDGRPKMLSRVFLNGEWTYCA